MIRITYTDEQTALAERIRDDLVRSIPAAQPLLIVLVSAASNVDPVVQQELASALAARERIIPILTDRAEAPPPLQNRKALDFSRGYSRKRLQEAVAGAATPRVELRRANRRALTIIGMLAALMFGLAIASMAGGIVAFPVAEYNEEATFQAQWIDGLIRETLEAVQPRSTADAANFAATHEAAPTRLFYYIRETATALAAEQEG